MVLVLQQTLVSESGLRYKEGGYAREYKSSLFKGFSVGTGVSMNSTPVPVCFCWQGARHYLGYC